MSGVSTEMNARKPHAIASTTPQTIQPRRIDDLIDMELLALAAREKVPVVEMTTEGFERHGGKSSTNFKSAWKMYTGVLGLRLRGPGR